ncbi:MAG: YceI family protein [Fluviicola sp.]|nr:YceI family protein [Fluviicola sp.]
MKKTVLSFALLALVSCGSNESSTQKSSSATELETPKVEEVVYQLDTKNASMKWDRVLDQKPTKQKVMILGSEVDVELGAVKLNSSGEVTATSGELRKLEDAISGMTVKFDMQTFQLSAEKQHGLFDTKKYPESTLLLDQFGKPKNGEITAKGMLTIQGKSKPVTVQLKESSKGTTVTIDGSMKINTLDWPLRSKVTAKDVNVDQITVQLHLTFKK